MEAVFHFFAIFVSVLLDAVSLAMIARMITSLIFQGGGGKFTTFLVCITEPFIIPVRFILAKMNILQNSPIDWSFTIAYLILMLVRLFLPAI